VFEVGIRKCRQTFGEFDGARIGTADVS
jgi:hypothetical protein